MTETIKNALERYVKYISSLDGILRIYLFGSYAYGAPYEGSDIDIMVIIEDSTDALKTNLKIQKGLCDRFVSLDVLVNNISKFEEFAESPSLQNQIKHKGALLYDKRLMPDLA